MFGFHLPSSRVARLVGAGALCTVVFLAIALMTHEPPAMALGDVVGTWTVVFVLWLGTRFRASRPPRASAAPAGPRLRSAWKVMAMTGAIVSLFLVFESLSGVATRMSPLLWLAEIGAGVDLPAAGILVTVAPRSGHDGEARKFGWVAASLFVLAMLLVVQVMARA